MIEEKTDIRRRAGPEGVLWRRLADAIRRESPDIEVSVSANGLRWRRGRGDAHLLGAKDVRRFSGPEDRAAYADRSYFDVASGTLRLVGPGVLVHLKTDVRAVRLTPLESCLTAVLCDAEPRRAGALVAGPTGALARWLELTCGAYVTEMTASRLKRALLGAGVVKIAATAASSKAVGSGAAFNPSAACDRIAEDFRFSSIGPAVRYAIPRPDSVRERLSELPKGEWIEGASALVLESGANVDERDFVVERGVARRLEEILGAPIRRTKADGFAATVRIAQRFSIRFVEDRRRPGRLHRLLAAAGLRRARGPLSEVGEALWRKVRI